MNSQRYICYQEKSLSEDSNLIVSLAREADYR